MSEPLNGLATINIELTSRCNKSCWMCGMRELEKVHPEMINDYGDMGFGLLEKIADQIPEGIVVQFHRYGEPLLYPRLGDALRLFPMNIRNIVTNGKLLVAKAHEIIANLETMSISVFEGDTEAKEQLDIISKFLSLKKGEKPFVSLRLIGDVDEKIYQKLGQMFIRRVLHAPIGNRNYLRQTPTIPEIGVCWDFLQHPCISRKGDFSICVQLDPAGEGVLGNIKEQNIAELWNGEKRRNWKALHLQGLRGQIPFCAHCEYWGVPT